MSTHWNIQAIPDLKNHLAVVTGGNSGIGYEAALVLAGKGAHVIIAARSAEKGARAVETIRRAYPNAQVQTMALDLANLNSVRAFAETFKHFGALSLLINNAGVMALPYRKTADNFEMQFGTNHLGHYVLTGLLLPALLAAPNARVVTVSSGMHNFGKLEFDNLDGSKKYNRWNAYSASKLANLWFAYELDRKFKHVNANAISVGCHPGYAATNLQYGAARIEGSKFSENVFNVLNRVLATSAAEGALPTLYAATASDVQGGDYIGPDGLFGARGKPVKTRSSKVSYAESQAQELWHVSEELTQVRYAFDKVAVV